MGVAGLWEILKPAAETRSLTDLAITEGFIGNPQGLRGFRVGIDASIWFFHAEYGKEGENPVLRTLFFRCATLMKTTFLPLFVFDGPKRPDFKRGKKINKTGHKLIPGMKAIIEAFGFEWRMAPAEAEAELAYLNRVGIIDGILSDDVDNFLFGATTIIRNVSNNLSGNRANPILNSQGRDDKNHTRLYRASKIQSHPSVSLTRGGLILIGLLSGGDYAQAGLPGCGITTAHALARCGFGDSLTEAATTLSREALPDFLYGWRRELREELRTNSRGIIGRKLAKLAKEVPSSFPDIDILLSYTNPITSDSLGRAAEKNLKLTWSKEPDVGKLAGLCEFYFEWGYKESIIKRFRTLLWHSIVLRVLRRAVINADDFKSDTAPPRPETPSTPRKKKGGPRIVGTPSKMISKHFAALGLHTPSRRSNGESESEGDEDEERLIIRIHSSRKHASTDGLVEYRLEIAPAQLVQMAESGIKGTREAPETDEWASDEAAADDDDSESGKKTKGPKPPPDPTSHLRLWMPACMVEMAEPEVVEEFKEREEKKAAKKNGKTRKEPTAAKKKGATASRSSGASRANRSKGQSDNEACQAMVDMLPRKGLSVLSTPSRASNIRRTKHPHPLCEESEESESDLLAAAAALPSKTLSNKNHTQPRKMSAERQKNKVSVLDCLPAFDDSGYPEHGPSLGATSHESIRRAMAPAPFPISLGKDDDVFSSSDALILPSMSGPAKKAPRAVTPEPEVDKSPRKSIKHSSPRHRAESRTRPVSPSPMRPSGKLNGAADRSIIELSSDDSDFPNPITLKKSSIPPLILAKARSKNKGESSVPLQTSMGQFINRTVIDLT